MFDIMRLLFPAINPSQNNGLSSKEEEHGEDITSYDTLTYEDESSPFASLNNVAPPMRLQALAKRSGLAPTYEDESSTLLRRGAVRDPMRLQALAKHSGLAPAPEPYRILVIGERRVGKTAFIEALYSLAKNRPFDVNEYEFKQTTRVFSKYIPATSGKELNQKTMIEYSNADQYSNSFTSFLIGPHGKQRVFAVNTNNMLRSKVMPRNFNKILISEFPSDTEFISEDIVDQFDKIIIMAEYPDITTMRSILTWASIASAAAKKTIICVNKCDVEASSDKEDFQERKAKVMDHFVSQCAVEYISVKTNANVGFIYKYMDEDR